jgi:hypothetical protein
MALVTNITAKNMNPVLQEALKAHKTWGLILEAGEGWKGQVLPIVFRGYLLYPKSHFTRVVSVLSHSHSGSKVAS